MPRNYYKYSCLSHRIAYDILPEQHLILTYFEGKITVKELFKINEEFMADERFNIEFNQIMDMRSAIGIGFSFEILEYFNFLKNTQKFTKRIHNGVVATTPNIKLLTSIFGGLSKLMNIDTKSFSEMETCIDWMQYNDNDKAIILKRLSEF